MNANLVITNKMLSDGELDRMENTLLEKAYDNYQKQCNHQGIEITIPNIDAFKSECWLDIEKMSKYLKEDIDFDEYRYLLSSPMHTFSGELYVSDNNLLISGPYKDEPQYVAYDPELRNNISLTIGKDGSYHATVIYTDRQGNDFPQTVLWTPDKPIQQSVETILKAVSVGMYKERIKIMMPTKEDMEYLINHKDLLYIVPYDFETERYFSDKIEEIVKERENIYNLDNIENIEYNTTDNNHFEDYYQLAIRGTSTLSGDKQYKPIPLLYNVETGDIKTIDEVDIKIYVDIDYTRCGESYDVPHPELDGYWAERDCDRTDVNISDDFYVEWDKLIFPYKNDSARSQNAYQSLTDFEKDLEQEIDR